MLEVLKCKVCGKIVMVIHNGGGTSVCCDQPMELQVEHAKDPGKEKHVPVIEKTKNGILVKVGEISHPMVEDHYIEWIEVIEGSYLHVKGLQPGDTPSAEFALTDTKVKARAYCNKHGLWSNKPSKSQD
ncbi:MAG: desulfoferrodoxin [Methanoregula sp.]|nr:desulfoferrodoxin [Methanoregula sp.]